MNTETKSCQNCKQQFIIEADDFLFYEKMKVPAPTFCPSCRLQRRLMFMNERILYKRQCNLCGKGIVNMYPAESKLTVYCSDCWWSDKWDGLEYGVDYDPNKPFLEQLRELHVRTPQVATASNIPTLVNSDYINHAATSKNCYLIFTADNCENVLYSEILNEVKDTMDCSLCVLSELCYESIDCYKDYKVWFSEDCESCHEVYFSKNCVGCSNCFGCVNLRNKNYYIWNQPHTKEQYENFIKEANLSSYSSIVELTLKARSFWLKFPHEPMKGSRNNKVTGDYIADSKNAKDMFIVAGGAEDCRYCQIITMPPTKDAYDYTIWGNVAERVYECMIVGQGASNVKFSYQAWPNVMDVEYCIDTLSSSHMFGCSNIRNKKYCILNKQYGESAFNQLKKIIIKDMDEKPFQSETGLEYKYGEFLPPDLSLFAYNESYAQSFFPLNKDQAHQHNYKWSDGEKPAYNITVQSNSLPDSINGVGDRVVNEIIECQTCAKAYRIARGELALLKRFGLPLPRNCPNCRYNLRLKRINPMILWRRSCMCNQSHANHQGQCRNEFETSYSPDRPEVVYCKECLNQELI